MSNRIPTSLVRAALWASIVSSPLTGQAVWHNASATPESRAWARTTWDSARSRILLVAGYNRGHFLDTWERRGTNWDRVATNKYPNLGSAVSAYDAGRDRVVLYGNNSLSGRQTWEFDGATWTQRTSDGPPVTVGQQMAYDPVRGRTVLFGSGSYDTWEWDGGAWTMITPQNSPPPRSWSAMVWHAGLRAVVLHGGTSLGTLLGDTWAWDGIDWRRIGSGPVLRDLAMTYDAGRDALVLFGGNDGTFRFGSDATWEWTQSGGWQRRNPATVPPARYATALVYDPIRGRVVMFGGNDSSIRALADTWEWNGIDWRPVGSVAPLDRAQAAMAYDSSRERVVLFGGRWNGSDPTPLGDTWEWSGQDWQRMQPATAPARRAHAMAYDPVRRAVVMSGGFAPGGTTPSGETWEYDGVTWTRRSPDDPAQRRERHAMAFDAGRGRVLAFGGIVAGGLPDTTWEWDGSRWTQVPTPTRPPGRAEFGLAYDERRGRLVMFGGQTGGTARDDTWEFDGADWQLRSNGPLAPRYGHTMAYDAFRERIVVYGGVSPAGIDGETWEWDGVTWTEAGLPRGRRIAAHAMAYDARNRETVRFGGWVQPSTTWAFRSPNPAGFEDRGGGCAGSTTTPHLGLAPFGWPWLGDDLELLVTSLPPAPEALAFGLIGLDPADIDLTIIDMPGCRLLVDPLVDLLLVNQAGTASWTIPMPTLLQAQFVGRDLHMQAVVLDAGANRLGAVTTNATRATIGRR